MKHPPRAWRGIGDVPAPDARAEVTSTDRPPTGRSGEEARRGDTRLGSSRGVTTSGLDPRSTPASRTI
ncbi:hypothetical protein FCG67_04075 [Rhodococcus oryzae]|uniref:Uncharacterized protein n=1 Tax=Rhodococcus oryzae TaxID=2571143 RepID=A0ABY2RNN0_9NOCA|nr:hypothetical protein [Rhodococcus oryzae]TJZ80072.1 hypothetical protein FCG67_04075 [Rhodococcus oryzae]